ncbi:glycosyltransferase family 4 protein [Rhodopirellula sp. JC740]|uniref:Glycosyltransferase family 4 protein n=1 Tax=Rhodopirellula halodulae TaxID=2894198 RepID=A0ABS8NL52_9BACT|nr:glycosyltransferase family 4 protein [Rhodopirellula sp. JC740]MCC9643543.1 glycosyltransferase family 4 protein [Rhodopirellula sp. JC740]
MVPFRKGRRKLSYGSTFGGLETAMWTLAKDLADISGVQVTCFVTAPSGTNGGTPWPSEVDGVRLDLDVDRFRGIRHSVGESIDVSGLRLRKFSPHLLWQIPLLAATYPFRDRDPVDCHPDPRLAGKGIDAWVTFGVNAASSRVVATASAENTPAFVCIQSNAGLEDSLLSKEETINECGESSFSRRYALMECHRVVAQSEWQLNRLKQSFQREGLLARNPIDPADWCPPYQSEAPASLRDPFDVLWIGRYDDFHKRPLMMLEVARKLPHVSFKMIANPFDEHIESQVRKDVPKNVDLIDRVPFERMPAVFGSASVFVSTGSVQHEGFPNVLLQSAASHTPIVSTCDHDNFLRRSGAGVSCDDSIDRLASSIEDQLQSPIIDWRRVDEYLNEFHYSPNIAKEFANWINDAIRDEGRTKRS